jgi:hypothetical protein
MAAETARKWGWPETWLLELENIEDIQGKGSLRG